MELEFDKEIDALLRGTGRGGETEVSTGEHVDPDAASLFAEGLLPEAARVVYVRHSAECSRCRKLLSGAIALNSDPAETAAKPAVMTAHALAETRGLPWYRRLFAMPQLAYVMGGLILVFAGVIGLQVLQNSPARNAASGDVPQVTSSEPQGSGPNLGPEDFNAPAASSNSAAANMTSNSAATKTNSAPNSNATANSNAARALGENRPSAGDVAKTEEAKKLDLDGTDAKQPATQPALAAPSPAPKPADKEKAVADRRDENAAGVSRQNEPSADTLMSRSAEAQTKDDTRRRGPAKVMAGPSRNQNLQFPNAVGTGNSAAATRRVAGKTFEYNDGVWYDTAYHGRPTINVRRGSADFGKLDEGLRSIAASIGGTVVVVWKERSYRID